MSFTINDIIHILNTFDFPVLIGLFGFIGAVIVWGIIKHH